MELAPTLRERVLAEWPVARLATVTPGGAPHQVPIVFAVRDGVLYTAIDGKPKRNTELVRVRNLRANPRVCVLCDAYHSDWTRLWWLRVDGQARVLGSAEGEAGRAALQAKYRQYTDVPVLAEGGVVIAVAIDRISSWCASAAAEPFS